MHQNSKIDSKDRLMYTVHEVAGILRYEHARTVSRMIDSGEIRAVRVRGRWMILHTDLLTYLETLQTNESR
jgi:excisionase family DNA binding protein